MTMPAPTAITMRHGVPAQEMTKWFDTNYHYMVPELTKDQTLRARLAQADRGIPGSQGARLPDPAGAGRARHLPEARQEQGCRLRPAVAARPAAAGLCRGAARARRAAAPNGCRSTNPASCSISMRRRRKALRHAYAAFARRVPAAQDHADDLFRRARRQSRYRAGASGRRAASSISCARREQIDDVAEKAPKDLVLSLGVIDGRNIWRAELPAILDRLEPVVARRGSRAQCRSRRPARCCMCRSISSLETDLDPEVKSWLAFSVQKIERTGDARQSADGRPRACASS